VFLIHTKICHFIQRISHILRTRMFITLVTTVRHCSLSLPKWVKCTSPDWFSERSILVLSFRVLMFLPSDLVRSCPSTKLCVHFPYVICVLISPTFLTLLHFITVIIFGVNKLWTSQFRSIHLQGLSKISVVVGVCLLHLFLYCDYLSNNWFLSAVNQNQS